MTEPIRWTDRYSHNESSFIVCCDKFQIIVDIVRRLVPWFCPLFSQATHIIHQKPNEIGDTGSWNCNIYPAIFIWNSRGQCKQNHALFRMNCLQAFFLRCCSHWRCWIRFLINKHLSITSSSLARIFARGNCVGFFKHTESSYLIFGSGGKKTRYEKGTYCLLLLYFALE